MITPGYKDKFIGFVDILGFKDLIKESEAGCGLPLSDILELLKILGCYDDVEKVIRYGPSICPSSKYIEQDIDFCLTQISDCVVISTKISPAGAINLIKHCWSIVLKLLLKGILCRGYITRGSIYHTNQQVIGTGYQTACSMEKNVSVFRQQDEKAGTPFVEIAPSVTDYIQDSSDSCVKEMFLRFTVSDGAYTAIYPFSQLSHSFLIGNSIVSKFDADREISSNQSIKKSIVQLISQLTSYLSHSDQNVVRKVKHYISALEKQLGVCDTTDQFIGGLRGVKFETVFPPILFCDDK